VRTGSCCYAADLVSQLEAFPFAEFAHFGVSRLSWRTCSCDDPFVPDLLAHDGTRLTYHVVEQGRPVVCVQGGPMQDSVYLGDLGGLSGCVRLILLDCRGTGQSQTPADGRGAVPGRSIRAAP
jgi:hypothetical protein